MMHPLLHLIAKEPNLLAEHAEAYAELLGEEFGQVSSQWKRRALLSAVALCSAGVGTVLTGVALMLWAVLPPEHINAPWALVAAPLVPLALAVGCWLTAQAPIARRPFEHVRQQLREDVAMFREASAS